MESRHEVLTGIVKGIPKHHRMPAIDGIYQGAMGDSKYNSGVKAGLHKVVPSATRFSEGVFGAGRTAEGKGNASAAAGEKKRRTK